VDKEPQETTKHKLTAEQIMKQAGVDPKTHYLIRLKPHGGEVLKGHPEAVIRPARLHAVHHGLARPDPGFLKRTGKTFSPDSRRWDSSWRNGRTTSPFFLDDPGR
jgi:hypothetical protein